MPDWIWDRGFPAGVLLLILYYAMPRIGRLYDSHIDLVEHLKINTQAQTNLMGQQLSNQMDHGQVLAAHGKKLDSHGETLRQHTTILGRHGDVLTRIEEKIGGETK